MRKKSANQHHKRNEMNHMRPQKQQFFPSLRNTTMNTPMPKQRVPIYPLVAGILGVVFLSLVFFTQLEPSITGFAVKDGGVVEQATTYCLKEGRDGLNHQVTDKSQCCFLIENTERCIGPLENTAASYLTIDEEHSSDTYAYEYACSGGSARKVLFTTIVKRYCGTEI